MAQGCFLSVRLLAPLVLVELVVVVVVVAILVVASALPTMDVQSVLGFMCRPAAITSRPSHHTTTVGAEERGRDRNTRQCYSSIHPPSVLGLMCRPAFVSI
jgi:hypothetical protein